MIGMTTSPHPPDYEGFGDWSDPYLRCEDRCNHDLAHGVLITDLFSSDGPYAGLFSKLHIRCVEPTNVTQLLTPPSTQRQQQEGDAEHEGNG